MKTIAIYEIICFSMGVLLLFTIPYWIAKQSNINYTVMFGLGIFEGLLVSSFARNAKYFPATFKGWKNELTDFDKERTQ